ncbi:hypothetical protein [Streptomyces sp. H27-H1]|uniref:hypothetical protein n=1 Tax=Streptomyces sp. H27-H1 TaxID=2996461 RepID=UPI003B6410CF
MGGRRRRSARARGRPERHRGAGLALVQTGQALARFAASLGFGAAWTFWGARPALAVAAALLAGAVLLCVRLRPAGAALDAGPEEGPDAEPVAAAP